MSGNRFLIEPTAIAGVHSVTRRRLADERGFLSRLFEPEELALAGWHGPIAQINETGTARAGTVRGLHGNMLMVDRFIGKARTAQDFYRVMRSFLAPVRLICGAGTAI